MMATRMMMGGRNKRNAPNSATSRQSHARSTQSVATRAEAKENQEVDTAVVGRCMAILPTILVFLGIFLLLVGVPVLICGFIDSLNYPQGQRHGPGLIVFGVIFLVVGFIWVKIRENRAKKLLKESRENQVRENQVSDSRQTTVTANSSASVSRTDAHQNAAKTEDVRPKLDKNAAANPPDVGTGLPNDGYEVDLSDYDEKKDAEKV